MRNNSVVDKRLYQVFPDYKMIKTINQGYIPSDLKAFAGMICEVYKDVSLFDLSKCNCGKKKPPKK